MLSAAELSAMRATQVLALPSTATISDRAQTADGAGGRTETYTARSAATVARMAAPNAEEAELAARMGVPAPFIATFPHGTDLVSRDRFTVDGVVYEVTGVVETTAWSTAARVFARPVG